MSTPHPLSSETRPSRGDGHCTDPAVLAPSPAETPLESEETRYRREDRSDPVATAVIARSVQRTLEMLGEDPGREGLLKTPERVAKAYQFLTHGYGLDPRAILRSALFEEDYSEMILVKDIEVYSLCEHHTLPFFGKAHVAYIPNGTIVGLSKIPRVVDVFARRLQVQERLTIQIRDVIDEVLQPLARRLAWATLLRSTGSMMGFAAGTIS